ncbi:MAG TPA: HD domain-containing protein [Caldithrix abyssi]|uniref:HD domain-containing protein n=1 Tax=Caldithrix abyssi TaxID=187145 RepID=A0A7V1PWQ2_CALAY|nr:HD domain-containing protein [Caldithrix abyssi]
MFRLFEYIHKNRGKSVGYLLAGYVFTVTVMAIVQKLWFDWNRPLIVIALAGYSILVLVLYQITRRNQSFQRQQARLFFLAEMLPLIILPALGFLNNPLFPLAFLLIIVGDRFLLGRHTGFQLNALIITSFIIAVLIYRYTGLTTQGFNEAAFTALAAVLLDGVCSFSLSIISHMQRKNKELERREQNLKNQYRKVRKELYLNTQIVHSLHKDVKKKNIEIKNILTMSGQLNETADTQQALESFLLTIIGQIGSNHALILTRSRREHNYYSILAAKGFRGSAASKVRFYLNSALMGYIDGALEPFPVSSIPHGNLFSDEIKLLKLFEQDIFCPILIKGQLSGLLVVGKKMTGKVFTNEDLNLISIVANQTAFVMEQAQLTSEFQDIYFKTIKAMMKALEAKYVFARGHNTRTATYVSKVATKMGLTPNEIKELTYGTLLHDVGKIAIRDKYLLDPKVFGENESLVKQKILEHTIKGAAILRSAGFDDKIVDLALHHHESFDGKGYPHKIGGGELNDGVRILSVCNTFDAMTSDRPHRKALSQVTAREYLEYNAGKRFDTQVVKAFIAHLDESRQMQKYN